MDNYKPCGWLALYKNREAVVVAALAGIILTIEWRLIFDRNVSLSL